MGHISTKDDIVLLRIIDSIRGVYLQNTLHIIDQVHCLYAESMCDAPPILDHMNPLSVPGCKHKRSSTLGIILTFQHA